MLNVSIPRHQKNNANALTKGVPYRERLGVVDLSLLTVTGGSPGGSALLHFSTIFTESQQSTSICICFRI
jgi:hypothetical protein